MCTCLSYMYVYQAIKAAAVHKHLEANRVPSFQPNKLITSYK